MDAYNSLIIVNNKILSLVLFLILTTTLQAKNYKVTQSNYKEIFCHKNATYRVDGVINLANDTITFPYNSHIECIGGKITNGTLKGNNTIFGSISDKSFQDIQFIGSFDNAIINYSWFDNYKTDTSLLGAIFELAKYNNNPIKIELEPFRKYNIYHAQLDYGRAIYEFIGSSNIIIEGNGSTINDLRPRQLVKYRTYDGVFLFSNCKQITINRLNYVNLNEDYNEIQENNNVRFKSGFENQIGYVGTSFILLQNDCSKINIKSIITGARYGVKSGDYSKYWLCGEYGLKDSRIDIDAYKTGYPVAIEIGDSLNISICSTKHHRAAYLCGISNSTINIRAKDLYIAPYHCLLSDSRYSKSKDSIAQYKACSNLDVNITDLGTQTATNPDSYCVGFQTYKFFEKRETPLLWQNINISIAKENPAPKIGLFSINRPHINGNNPLSLPDIFRNINIKATDKFKSEQYAFRIVINPYGQYNNINIEVYANKNNAIIDNQNTYNFDLSKCILNAIFNKSN